MRIFDLTAILDIEENSTLEEIMFARVSYFLYLSCFTSD